MPETPATARLAATKPTHASTAIATRRFGISTPQIHIVMLPYRRTQENGKAGQVAAAGLTLLRTIPSQPVLMCLALIDRSTVIANTAVIMSRAATMRNTADQLPVTCFM